jgi:hypothetical protein
MSIIFFEKSTKYRFYAVFFVFVIQYVGWERIIFQKEIYNFILENGVTDTIFCPKIDTIVCPLVGQNVVHFSNIICA